MKTILKIAVITTALLLMLIADVPFLLEQDIPIPIPFKQDVQTVFEQLVPDAHAILGVRRRTRRRTAVVVGTSSYAAGAASAAAAESQEQVVAPQQQSAPAQQQAGSAPPPPAATGNPLPLGTVVSTLPAGCTSTAVGGVEYYHCGSNYYRAAFQGNNLVYVTAKP